MQQDREVRILAVADPTADLALARAELPSSTAMPAAAIGASWRNRPEVWTNIGRMTNVVPTDDRELPGEAESWHRLHEVIDRITPEVAEIPGYFEEGWTAKDAVAHIGTWMAEGAQMLRRIAAGTYREGEIDIDAENERYLAAMRDIPLDTVHLQVASAHAELLRAWAQLPEITPAATYWVRKAGPEHVAEHLPRLEEWVDEVTARRA